MIDLGILKRLSLKQLVTTFISAVARDEPLKGGLWGLSLTSSTESQHSEGGLFFRLQHLSKMQGSFSLLRLV
jgi:hypothetical protein